MEKKSKTIRNNLPYIIIGFAVASVLLLSYKAWKPLELKAYDLRFQIIEHMNIGRSQTKGDVVIVGIDEKTMIREKPVLFVYPDIGRFIKKMKEYGASVIAIDLIPVHEQGEKFKKGIYSLYDSNPDNKHLAFINQTGERLDKSLLEPIISVSQDIPVVQAFSGEMVPFYYGASAFMKKIHMADIVLTDGNTVLNDGVIRKQSLSIGDKKTFACTIYNLLSNKEAEKNSVNLNYSLLKNIPFYCFTDIINGRISIDSLAGKAVILGYISSYEDIHPTPAKGYHMPECFSNADKSNSTAQNSRLSGPLIHATIVETLLTQTAPEDMPFVYQVFILLFMTGTGFIISMKLKPYNGIPLTILIMAGFFAVNIILFSKGIVIDILPAVLSPFIMQAFLYPYKYIAEERAKKKIYKLFGYYIDKEVIDSLIEKDPSSILKGEKKDVCILFLDIRNFTKLSTSQKAENIVQLLNLFFGRITDIIKQNNGFVNKFIGDGVLAFFATGQNVVSNAVFASREIIKETKKLNKEGAFIPFIGDWEIQVGIGIHFGTVIMGNIGSEKKMDFTIIGEHVNVASRIEGLTKQANRPLLLSNAAYTVVKDNFSFEYLGDFMVKGIEDPIAIYTLTDL